MSSTACDPFDLLRDAIEAERARTGSIKAAIGHVSVAFGLSPRRVRGVWHGEPIRLDWQEAQRIRAVAARRLSMELAEIETRQAALILMQAQLDEALR